jgi:hypothetical protein
MRLNDEWFYRLIISTDIKILMVLSLFSYIWEKYAQASQSNTPLNHLRLNDMHLDHVNHMNNS